MADFKRILVPTDFSQSSVEALDVAVDIAARYGASITLYHVCELPIYSYPGVPMSAFDSLTPIQDAARRQLDEVTADLKARSPGAEGVLEVGLPWQRILGAVEAYKADLVVMGTHGRRGLTHAFMGSVAERIVRECPVPVLTVRMNAKR
jgi:nucleotide-binding universal stress UspA family protein